MRSDSRVGVVVVALALLSWLGRADAAGPPKRKPLNMQERDAVLALITAVDAAQTLDTPSDDTLAWDNHVLKAGELSAYVPFRLTLSASAERFKATAMYVRAVSRRDGVRASEEHSSVRDWLLKGGDAPAKSGETVFIGPGEMPVGGPGISSSRQSTAAAAQAFAALALRERQYEKERRAAEAEKKQEERRERDPFRFPFEDYHFVDLKSARTIERALALPPGEYDVYVALVDRARVKTSSPAVLHRTVTIPDWSETLVVSSLILATAVKPLKAPLSGQQQIEHPYAFGLSEVVPVSAPTFTPDEALTVVFQIANYGAPDADLTIDYAFYRTDGARRLFNRTAVQEFSDADLPPPRPWDTQAFTMQSVPLARFAPGGYELEVTVKDRLTRTTARGTVAFTVVSGVR
jgi:hypothetical protein